MSGHARLRRVTLNLALRAAAALDSAIELTGESQTEVVNRALILYEFVHRGDGVYVRRGDEWERIVLL